MIELEFYEDYLAYLDWKLEVGYISKGKYSLLKITKSEYDKFVERLEIDETFNEKIIKIIRAEHRDKKISSIVDCSEKIDDFFDDFNF